MAIIGDVDSRDWSTPAPWVNLRAAQRHGGAATAEHARQLIAVWTCRGQVAWSQQLLQLLTFGTLLSPPTTASVALLDKGAAFQIASR